MTNVAPYICEECYTLFNSQEELIQHENYARYETRLLLAIITFLINLISFQSSSLLRIEEIDDNRYWAIAGDLDTFFRNITSN